MKEAKGRRLFHLLLIFHVALPKVDGAGCSATIDGTPLSFDQCADLDGSGSFTLAWTVLDSNSSGITVRALYTGVPEQPYGWAGWGVSPTGLMVGSSAIVGYGNLNNPSAVGVGGYELTGPLSSLVLRGQSNSLLTPVPSSLAVEVDASGMRIKTYAVVTLPTSQPLHIIWKSGPPLSDFSSGQLVNHYDLTDTTVLVNFSGNGSSPDVTPSSVLTPNLEIKQAHAFLAGIGFGVLLPLGILSARHLKSWVGPAWVYLHAGLQATGYLAGVAGWGVGVWLREQFGDFSVASSAQHTHFAIAMTIFSVATLQVLTPLAKPNKLAPHRIYWNLLHWGLGYSTVILAFVQIFFGFAILREEGVSCSAWQTVYIVLLCVWVLVMSLLELLSWHRYLQTPKPNDQHLNGSVSKNRLTPPASEGSA